MRIQNEIVGERFNRFSDMVDMDRFAAQEYTPDIIVSISESLASLQNQNPLSPLNQQTAREITEQARTGSIGIPQLIQIAMQEVNPDV